MNKNLKQRHNVKHSTCNCCCLTTETKEDWRQKQSIQPDQPFGRIECRSATGSRSRRFVSRWGWSWPYWRRWIWLWYGRSGRIPARYWARRVRVISGYPNINPLSRFTVTCKAANEVVVARPLYDEWIIARGISCIGTGGIAWVEIFVRHSYDVVKLFVVFEHYNNKYSWSVVTKDVRSILKITKIKFIPLNLVLEKIKIQNLNLKINLFRLERAYDIEELKSADHTFKPMKFLVQDLRHYIVTKSDTCVYLFWILSSTTKKM